MDTSQIKIDEEKNNAESKENESIYSTTDIWLAIYLLYKEMTLLTVKKKDRQACFSFKSYESIKLYEIEFINRKAMVEVEFAKSTLRHLKTISKSVL